jgi:cellulose synthase/poly-beta-1,6-N-acetylglucosamine synthase-like glycosyltransferase
MTVIIPWIPFGIIGIVSWSIWALRRFRSRWGYRDIVNDYRTTTSLVVPVYKEDGDVLERCLRTWLVQDPTEVILVVDDLDDVILDRLHRLNLPRVQVLPWRHTGKRGALGAGVRAATCQVVVFADSDTSWRPGLLDAVQMPFADPEVGGVGTRQHVHMPRSALCRRVAYWLLNTRYLDYVPAMSRRGGVACLSGRTAAYRRAVIAPLMPALEHEIFLGKECVAGDDGRLTWLTLAAGYRTVHQGQAEADSMFPNSWTAFFRQRVRWSRNSYRCYLTAFAQGWLFAQPLITQITVMQILLTPLTMGAALFYLSFWMISGNFWTVMIGLLILVVGRMIRGFSHLRENPRDLLIAPLMPIVVAWIALPIKAWAFLSMNRQGWLTRTTTGRVQGQGEIHPSEATPETPPIERRGNRNVA